MKKFYILALSIIGILLALFALKTARDLQPVPATLLFGDSGVRKPQLVDRIGNPLSISYQNRWSVQTVPLREIPALLQNAFIESEDRRFLSHNGVDWPARVHASAQNLRAMKGMRGASTITEQVVRMLHPRPRTVWSRWLEGTRGGASREAFFKKRDSGVLPEPGPVRTSEAGSRRSGPVLFRPRSRNSECEGKPCAGGPRAGAFGSRSETRAQVS